MKFEFFSKKSSEEDFTLLCKEFSAFSKSKIPILVINYYKELPIHSKAVIETDDERMFALYLKETHLRVVSEKQKLIFSLPSGDQVLAHCRGINLSSGLVLFDSFQYIRLHSEKRGAFRVQLEKPLNIQVGTQTGKQAGMIHDLSLTGCCIKLFTKMFECGQEITIFLKMLSGAEILQLTIPAIIRRTELAKIPTKCGVEFILDTETEQKLMTFLSQKQLEIIRQLKE